MRILQMALPLSLVFASAASAEPRDNPAVSELVAEFPLRAGLEPTLPVQVGPGPIVFRHLRLTGGNTRASVWNADGSPQREIGVDIPGASEFRHTAVLEFADRSGYALAGVAIVGGQRQSVLCFLNQNGQYRSHRATHFWIGQMAEAADGTLWAFGETHSGDLAVLRRYSREGDQVESLIPRSAFPAGPAAPAANGGAKGGIAQLAVTATRLVLFSPLYQRLCEVDLSTRKYSCSEVEVPSPSASSQPAPASAAEACTNEESLVGLAMTPDNAVYATLAGPAHGPFELDRGSRRWVPLPEDLWHGESLNLILGARGDRVVYRAKQDAHFWELRQIKLEPRFNTSFTPDSAPSH